MDTSLTPTTYKNHRFPVEIISHAVWLYFCFCLSFRDVEELLLERGVVVTYEAIRQWYQKFGQAYATQLRRRRPRPGDKWHLDELFLTIKGEQHYLWRAVDQDGNILDILVQRRRDKKAAKKFFRKLLKGLTYVPRVIVTDKLKSDGAAKREIRVLDALLNIRLQPPSEHPNDVAFLLLCQLPPAFDAMPFRQTSSTAGRGRMLRDKDRVPAPRCLLAVMARLRGRQSLLDERGGVHEDHLQSSSYEVASVLGVERVLGAKLVLSEFRKQLVDVPHTAILRDRLRDW